MRAVEQVLHGPARATAEVGNMEAGSATQAVEMLTMAPLPWATMIGATSRTARATFMK